MRRLVLLFSVLSLGAFSFAAAADDDIIVTAKTGNTVDTNVTIWSGGGGRQTPVTITTSPSTIEVTWPVTVVVAGQPFEMTRIVRCTCQQLRFDLSDLP
jgi:hypothetical protein